MEPIKSLPYDVHWTITAFIMKCRKNRGLGAKKDRAWPSSSPFPLAVLTNWIQRRSDLPQVVHKLNSLPSSQVRFLLCNLTDAGGLYSGCSLKKFS